MTTARAPLWAAVARGDMGAMSSVLRRGGAAAIIIVLVVVVFTATRHEPEAIATPTTVPTTVATTAATVRATTTTTAPPAPPVTEPEGAPVPHPAGPRFPTMHATVIKPGSTLVYDAPNGRVVQSMPSPMKFSLQNLNFQVLEDPGTGWLRVKLKTRPNGSEGWIQDTNLVKTSTDYSIDVDVTAHWMTVYKGTDVFLSAAVVTGTAVTPTPVGDHYITEGVKEANQWGPHGIYIYGLSAHSDVLLSFDGGDGQIGIHGTNQPYLMGSAASNGCIRMTNEDIGKLIPILPMGVPIHVHY